MKNFYRHIDEALNLSTARVLSKKWNKRVHNHMFPDGKYRVYLELPERQSVDGDYGIPDEMIKLGKKIFTAIKTAEEETGILDAMPKMRNVFIGEGIVLYENERRIKIVKVLNRIIEIATRGYFKSGTGSARIIGELTNLKDDYIRMGAKHGNLSMNTNNLLVVISRHPYDIAGMSTDRGWTSCQDFGQGATPGNEPNMTSRTRCGNMKREVQAGTLVAYLIRKNDKNIKNPIGRIAIKPYKKVSVDVDYTFINQGEYDEIKSDFIESMYNDRKARREFYSKNMRFVLDDIDEFISHDTYMQIEEDVYDIISKERDIDRDDFDVRNVVRELRKASSPGLRDKPVGIRMLNLLKKILDIAEENNLLEQTFKGYVEEKVENNMRDEGYRTEDEKDEIVDRIREKQRKKRGGKPYFHIGSSIYGTVPKSIERLFRNTVSKWLREKQPQKSGYFVIEPDVYNATGEYEPIIDV